MQRTISAMVGKGSVNHNSRKFRAENVDGTRTHLNIDYCNENIKTVYHELFDEALERYNAKQIRSDRKIKDYYEKIRSSKQEKPFHEIILQVGGKGNMNADTENGELAKQILDEYYQGFQERNPQLRVFSAHLHMDEATPHLHIDFVPFTTGSKRGLDTRVSLKQALATQGFKGGSRGDTEWSQWIQSEKEQLAAVMERYGIEWEHLGTHEKHLSVLDYKKQERSREVKELEQELEDIGVVIELKEEREAQLNDEIHKQQMCLKTEREEAEKTLAIVTSLKDRIMEEGVAQEKYNKALAADGQELEDIIADKKKQLADVQVALNKARAVFENANEKLAQAEEELSEVKKLRDDLIKQGEGDYYLKEEVIQLRYENQNLKKENKGLQEKLDKAYEFMKKFVIEGKSMLDKFLEWIGEKVREGRGR